MDPLPVESPFRSTCLDGKVALVTGGGSGICFEVARQFGLHGAKVVIMGRRQKFLDDAVEVLASEGIDCFAVRGDVRSEESAKEAVEKTVRRYGKLDILLNGAAGNFLSNAHELSAKGFQTVMNIDVIGTFNMSRAAFDHLKQAEDATIINISANLHNPAYWYQVHSAAAKASVDSITRSLALEWGRHGVRVVGVAPGPIGGTPGMAKLAPQMGAGGAPGGDAAAYESFASGVAGTQAVAQIGSFFGLPLGRLGSKQDIGLACVFLASTGAGYITGQTISVDGGETVYKSNFGLEPEAVSQASRGVESRSRAIGVKSKL